MEKHCTNINKQRCIQENNEKLEKYNRCKTREQPKNQKIKTKLYIAQNI